MKGFYHYEKEAWKKPDEKVMRERMIEWTKGNVFTKIDKPLRMDRPRELGYKDKKGFVVVRVRIRRGGHKRPSSKQRKKKAKECT
jgi:large subunit ribosomal protein L15e